MNFKTTYVLFGLLAGVLLVFAIAVWRAGEDGTDTTVYLLPSLHKKGDEVSQEKIQRVEVERSRPQETLTFERDGTSKNWKITQPRELRADTFAVNDLVRQVIDAQTTPIDKPADLKSVGLDPPAQVITLHAEGGQEVKLNVGEATPGESSAVVYVTSSDRPHEVLGVRKNQLDSVFKKVPDFRSKDLIGGATSDVQSLKLSEGKAVVELKKSGTERWHYVQPPYGDAEAQGSGSAAADKPPSGVNSLLTDITGLRVEYKDAKDNDFVADDVKDLGKYHLDKTKDGVLRIEVEKVGENKQTSTAALLVAVAEKVGEKKDQYYAMLEGERDVVRIPADKVEPIRKLIQNPEALRNRNLVEFGDFKKPDALDVRNSYGLLEFRRPDSARPWQLYRDKAEKGQDVAELEVSALINKLTEKDLVKSFPDPKRKAQLGLEKPEPVVSIWLDAIDAEAKKKEGKPKLKAPDKPAVELRFGNREGGNVAVERRREGETEGSVVLVPEEVLDLVKRGPLAYLDRSLPQFNPGAIDATEKVTRLVLDRTGTTYEVTREKEGAPWKIVQPKELAGRDADPRAVEDILNTLNRLNAQKLVAEKADEGTLAKEYGLNPKAPTLRAVVTVPQDGKPKTFEYLFGNEEGKDAVYGKQGERDMVFTVSKDVVSALQKDLRDPTVFRFDPAKVQAVRLNGWQNVLPTPYTWELERKDGKWTVKAPPGVQLDEAKVGRLLEELSHLRAERFLDQKGAQDSQELKVAQGALEVEVRVEGEKEPLRLTVGKAEGDKGLFALSNRTGDSVFVVRKDPFEEVKKSPNYFKK